MSIKIGDSVPSLSLHSSSGKEVSLSDFKGSKIVLYFYPKDDTPGCTAEACSFRDHASNYAELNAVVLGVSKDPLKSHDKFIQKYGLPFELLSDEKTELAQAFGVWKEKSFMGKKFMGMERSTFLIDESGQLIKEWRNIKVANHVESVLETLKSL